METKMIRVPFDVELAKKITNGECEGRIVTREGRNARIICMNAHRDDNIVALIENEKGVEYPKCYASDGMAFITGESSLDLILEIPEYMTFKDGDVLHYDNATIVFKCMDGISFKYYCSTYDGQLAIDSSCYGKYINKTIRIATESEKNDLINALKENKNPKTKEYLKRFFGIEEKQNYDFKPFDKVLVRDDDKNSAWSCNIFSGKNEDGTYMCIGGYWDMCIPYNEQTSHLLGTTENYE